MGGRTSSDIAFNTVDESDDIEDGGETLMSSEEFFNSLRAPPYNCGVPDYYDSEDEITDPDRWIYRPVILNEEAMKKIEENQEYACFWDEEYISTLFDFDHYTLEKYIEMLRWMFRVSGFKGDHIILPTRNRRILYSMINYFKGEEFGGFLYTQKNYNTLLRENYNLSRTELLKMV